MIKYRITHPNGVNQEEFASLAESEQRRAAIATEAGTSPEAIVVEAIEMAPIEELPTIEPDWIGLQNQLRGSQIFAKAYTAGDYSIASLNALTLLLASITTTNNLDDLQFSFNRLRETMQVNPVGDFTSLELEQVSEMLQANAFPIAAFNLS